MNSLGGVLLLLLLGLLAVLHFRLRGDTAADDGPWPVFVKKPLSAPEQQLYFRLVKALPEHFVLSQVSLSRFLGVKGSRKVHAWHNRIHRLTADFLVCAKDARVLAVIELDDGSHKTDDQRRTDAKRQRALESAGVRVIRWQAKALPDEAAIRLELYSQAQAAGGATAPLRSPAQARDEGPRLVEKAQAGRRV
jgi:very-short-patch-repair endonuclease